MSNHKQPHSGNTNVINHGYLGLLDISYEINICSFFLNSRKPESNDTTYALHTEKPMTILQSVLPLCPITRICPSLINGSHIYAGGASTLGRFHFCCFWLIYSKYPCFERVFRSKVKRFKHGQKDGWTNAVYYLSATWSMKRLFWSWLGPSTKKAIHILSRARELGSPVKPAATALTRHSPWTL